jgi:hypothetical protein
MTACNPAQAIDLIELDGADLRRDPLAVRKATLASLLARAPPGTLQRAPQRGGRPTRVRARLQAGPRRHRVEAARFRLSFRALAALDQVEEPRLRGDATIVRG